MRDGQRPASRVAAWAGVLPGILLCIGVTAVSFGLERVEAQLAGRAWLEALVLAILVGTAIRHRVDAGSALGGRHPLQRHYGGSAQRRPPTASPGHRGRS